MSRVTTDVATEPVTLAEVKVYSKVETAAEDSYLTALISACRREIEAYTSLALAPQVIETVHDNWPKDDYGRTLSIWSPRVPVASVAVSVVGGDGNSSPAVETFSLRKGEGRLRTTGDAPEPGQLVDGLVILWSVGYGNDTEPLPKSLKDALLSLIDYRWVNRGSESGGIPADIAYKLNPFKVYQR